MKRSNKWLLGFLFAGVSVCLAIHGVLYSEYRKDHFIPAAKLHNETFEKQVVRRPRIISIDGAVWVNLVPSDSFSIELPRINRDADAGLFLDQPTVRTAVKLKFGAADTKAITWYENGDTLFIKGSNTQMLHRPWSAWFYRRGLPQVSILGPSVDEIYLNNGQLYVQGMNIPGMKGSTRLNIRNSTLWIGMQYDNGHQGPLEYFDSLNIQSVNTVTILNSAAAIHRLRMQLTDSSVVSDQFARLDSSVIQCSPNSRVDLSGNSLKKNQLIIR